MFDLTRRGLLGTSAAALAASPARAASDRLRLGMGAAKVATIDPIKLTQGVDNWAITHVFDLLVRGPKGRFADKPSDYLPELAESWTVSPDAKTWTFKLRRGVQFQKGFGEMTSDDVKFSFDRARDPKSGSVSTILYQSIVSIAAPAPDVVVFTLNGPDPLFLTSVIYNTSSNIVSRKAVEQKGDGFAMDPVGTGPYQIDSVSGELVKLVAFPQHWAGQPKTPKIEVQYIVDTSARTFAILGNTADMILAPAGPGTINAILNRDRKLVMDVALPGNSWSVAFNLTQKPFDDVRVRHAFAYAIDRAAISGSLTPPTPRVYGLNPPNVAGGLNAQNTPPELHFNHDPARAKALLAQAGFPNGFTFSCYCSRRDDYSSLMLMIQENLRQVGVNMDLKLVDHGAFHADNRKGLNSFTMRGGTYAPVPTVPIQNEALAIGVVKPDGSGGNNFAHYGVAMPGIDALFKQANDEPDLEKRLALCRQMEIKLLQDMPLISLTNTAYVIIRNPKMDVGFKVQSGYGYWRLTDAVVA